MGHDWAGIGSKLGLPLMFGEGAAQNKMINDLKMRRRHSQLNRINYKIHAKRYDFNEKDNFIES